MRLSAIGYRLSAVLMLVGTPLAAQTSLSIYRDGRVVVRRTLPLALQQGRNNLTLRLEALDPATLFSTDTSVSVASATVRYPTTKADALGRAIGQTLSAAERPREKPSPSGRGHRTGTPGVSVGSGPGSATAPLNTDREKLGRSAHKV